jgi:hypothetical protein
MKKILFFLSIGAMILSAFSTMEAPVPETTKRPVPNQRAAFSLDKSPAPLLAAGNGQVNIRCRNSLSDARVINSAIASSALGDEIIISGQCLINQTIKLLGDRTYRGTSRTGTVLKQADGANLIALLATDTFLENRDWTGTPVSIRYMTLDGNSAMNQGAQTDGIVLRSWLSVVRQMVITDMRGNGLRVTSKSANGTGLFTSQVNGYISENNIGPSGKHGIYVEEDGSQNATTDWTLVDNWIGDSGADGIHVENAAGWVIERNHIWGVPQNAIYANRAWGSSISDNYIEGFGETDQEGTWYGIYAALGGGAASTISNNRIFNIGVNRNGPSNPASFYDYLFIAVNYNIGVAAVTGNTLRGMGVGNETGLYYTGGNNELIVTSANNAVVDIMTPRLMDDLVTLSAGY